MEYLIESTEDGVFSSGDPMPGIEMNSTFSIMARSVELEVQHDASSEGKDPESLAVRLDIANQIASLRLTMFCQNTGFTQGELANQLGVTRETVNRIINGHSVIPYAIYERLQIQETIIAMVQWVNRTGTPAQKDQFELLLRGIRIGNRFAKMTYCLSAVFGPMAWQNFLDSNGSMTPIPAEQDAPEALSAALRKAVA